MRSPTSTSRAELEEFAEGLSAFVLPSPGWTAIHDERYFLGLDAHSPYAAVQRLRLRDADDVAAAVEEVRTAMRARGKTIGNWWVSDRSTPADLHELLLAHGLRIVEGDHEIAGLTLTQEPPPGPPEVEARSVASADEAIAAGDVAHDAFATPAERRSSADARAAQFEALRASGAGAIYGAWLDGVLVGSARAFFSPRGALLAGGSTLPEARGRGVYRALVRARWDDAVARGTPGLVVQAGAMSEPILRRLGFEQVCRFGRLEDVLEPA